MEISKDKKELLRKLKPGVALVLYGEAGTGKTTMGILCGQKLLRDKKVWQRVLYLTYSKLAKRQISDCMRKLKEEKELENEFVKRMDVLNYHSLWWDLICEYYCFLDIAGKPWLCTQNEIKEMVDNNLDAIEEKRKIIPNYFLNNDNTINENKRMRLVEALRGDALLYAKWGAKDFGKRAAKFMGEINFLSWAENTIIDRNHKGFFSHSETVWWGELLITKHPNILNCLKVRYPVLIIDEFQDTDIAQWEMVKLLAPDTIIAMADPKQTIHRWRGADPDRLNQFRSHFEESTDHIFDTFTLTHKNRAPRDMSKPENIDIQQVSANGGSMVFLRLKTQWKCKSIVKSKLRAEITSIGILCLSNTLARDITNCLRQSRSFETGRLLPLDCARMGAVNSPYEAAKEIILQMLDKINGSSLQLDQLHDYIANELLWKVLPLSKSKLRKCSGRSRNTELVKRWVNAANVTEIISKDFGLGLVTKKKFIYDQAHSQECLCDKPLVNCIGNVGMSLQRVGKLRWDNLGVDEKRRKIEGLILQYENSIAVSKSERVSVMTVHQSKGREFDIVIIPWLSTKKWDHRDMWAWDMDDSEITNLYYTACTRAKKSVIVICPEGAAAKWHPNGA